MRNSDRRVRAVLVCAGLACVTLATYAPVGGFAFLNYDDPDYVSRNPVVQHGLSWDGLAWAFTARFANNWHPVTWLSHMLDCQLFGLNPGAHHWVSVVIHAVSALLLLLVFARMTGAWWKSAFVAALFALHPLHVESVAWVAERKDVLSGLFWILTMGAYAAYVDRPRPARYLLVVTCFVLGLLAKPMVVTLPFVLLLLDYWPLRRPERRIRRLIAEKLPLFALSVASGVITLVVQRDSGAMGSIESYSIPLRIASALVAYAVYLVKLLLPRNLAALYPHPGAFPLWQIAGSAALLVVFSAAALATARRRPYVLVGWIWFLGTLVPVIGLIQVGAQSMADRYTYLPSIGLFVLLTWSAAELAPSGQRRNAALGALAVAIVLGCAVATRAQLRHWRDTVSLFTHALAVTRDNAIAHYNLGQALSLLGRADDAQAQYEAAIRIEPAYPQAQNNLGLTLFMKGEAAAAIERYTEALRLDPKLGAVHFNLGIALSAQGQWERAIQHFTEAARADPNDPRIPDHLGRALRAQGKLAEAHARFRESVRLLPASAEAQYDLGVSAAELGDLDEAVAALSAATRLEPGSAQAHARLGFVLARRHEIREAIAQDREALRLDPNHVEALDQLAWVLATSADPAFRDGPEAVRLAERACRLTGYRRPATIGTLAAALARSGRFSEAVGAERKAHDLAVAEGRSDLAAVSRERLRLYEAGRPFDELRDVPDPQGSRTEHP